MRGCIDRLTELIQLDLESARAYDLALERIDRPKIREQIAAFRDDHLRHAHDLQEALFDLGGDIVVDTPEGEDDLIEGIRALREAPCILSALRVMGASEVVTTNAYDEALYEDMPPDLRSLIERHFADERRHLAFFDKAILAGQVPA